MTRFESKPLRLPRRHAIGRPAFTLVELLIVMSIMVVLLLTALPVFNYITGARSTSQGVNLAAAMLGRARALALSRTDEKNIGVLFYTDDEGRDAMQIVEVDVGSTSNELERYFSWQNNATYRTLSTDPADPHPADVVYSQTIDQLGGSGIPFTGRPVVKRYTSLQDGNTNHQPPDSSVNFVDSWWNVSTLGNVIPVSLDAEVQYMPRGVRARVVKLPTNGGRAVATPGIILFDKQGRVAKRQWGISKTSGAATGFDGGEKLLENMGLTGDLPLASDRVTGVALAMYNDSELSDNAIDPKDPNAVNQYAEKDADQYTVGLQSGELIGAPK